MTEASERISSKFTEKTYQPTRPPHSGAWMPYYDSPEECETARSAALADAAACEIDGYPTPETMEEWLSAMVYAINTYCGGLAEREAQPTGYDAVKMAKKALICAAYAHYEWARFDSHFGNYQPYNSGHYVSYHELASLAYEAPRPVPSYGAKFEEERIKKWIQNVRENFRAMKNSDLSYAAKRIFDFATGRY